MTRKSRFLALALVLCLLSSSFIGAGAQETTGLLYETETAFMQACGVLRSTVTAGVAISRADFTRLVVEVLYPEADFSAAVADGMQPFEDVPSNHADYAYLKAAKDLGIITGDLSNYFHPDRNVTYIEAIAITVNALCYTVYANARGGYPTGYYDIAKEIGLLDEISLSYNSEINGDTAVKLIYNAMFADMVIISSLTQGVPSFEINRNSNLMQERYDITEYKATVVDDGYVSLTGDSIGDEERVVLNLHTSGEDMAVYVGSTDISKQLGNTVRAYVKDNQATGRRELVYYTPYAKASELWVSSEWIVEQTDSNIEFERVRDSGKTEKASFRNPSILVNGVRYLKSFDTLNLANSLIRFVDSDDNNDYDYVLIYSFGESAPRNIVVDKITDEEDLKYIGCRLNPAKSLKCEDDDCIIRIVYGNAAALSDIPVGAVVSVAQSTVGGKTIYFLAVSDTVAEGAVESVGLNGGELTVGGVTYPVSKSYLAVKSEGYIKRLATAEGTVKCLIDVLGNIAFVESESVALKQYAYLIGAEVQTMDDVLKVKLFDPVEKAVVTMNLRSSATIDGKVCKGAAAQLARLQERPAGFEPLAGAPSAAEYISRPVIWKYNANKEITMLDTDTPNSQNNPSYTTVSDSSALDLNITMTPIKYSTTELEDNDALKASMRIMRESTHYYSANINSVSGKFYVTTDTELIGVPDIDTIGMKEFDTYSGANADNYSYDAIKAYEKPMSDANYEALTIADMMDKRYDMQAYDVDPITGVAGLVVVRGRESLNNYDWDASDMAIFLKTSEVYHAETDSMLTRVYYTYDGATEEYADFDFDDMVSYYQDLVYGNTEKGITPVKKGDVIRVGKALGKANHFERVVNIANVTDLKPSISYPYGIDIPYQANTTVNPFYVTATRTWPLNSTYVLCTGYVGEVQGDNFSMVTSASSGYSGQPLRTIDLTDPKTYSGMYFKFVDAEFPVTTIKADGSVDVKKGDISDVVSYAANGNSLEGSSIVMFYYARGDISQIRVINDLR